MSSNLGEDRASIRKRLFGILVQWSNEKLVCYILDKYIPSKFYDNTNFLEDIEKLDESKEETIRNGYAFERNTLRVDGSHFRPSDSNIMKPNNMNERIVATKYLNVLVIYTGGTIGMQKNDSGAYEPVPNAFLECVKSYPELHDQKYFNWLVAEGHLCEDSEALVIQNVRNHVTAICTIKEYDPLLDSSNMSSNDWIRIANDIHEHYNAYSGFVILHGTDTLTYTASALSFLLQNLDKAVIVTGSQIPIFETGSDAKSNFLNSIIFASVDRIKEVCVCFANKLTRGNRTVKVSSTQLNAFASPNYPNLGQVEMQLQVNNSSLWPKENPSAELVLRRNLESNVRELRFTPMMTLDMVRDSLRLPTRGIVLLSYGYGNIPNNMEGLMAALETAVKTDGIIIVNVTQCNQGTIGNSYATSQALESIGVIAGHDMTSVAVLVKLSYVLGRNDWSTEQKIHAMKSNLCGEMTLPDDN